MPTSALNKTLLSLGKWLMPPTCIVCGGGAEYRDLCHDCATALPWNRSCCARCAQPLAISTVLCGACSAKLPPWTEAKSPFVYDFPVDSLLRQLKFSRRLPNAKVLGQLMAEWIAIVNQRRPDVLVPVPLHWRRQLRRQFNQATAIARPVGQRLKIPVDGRVCRRRYRTPQQSGLPARDRRRNLRNAFVVRGDIRNAHLAIIDDVMTTGSTLAELSKVLLHAGAARVDVWTVARVAAPGVQSSSGFASPAWPSPRVEGGNGDISRAVYGFSGRQRFCWDLR